MRALRIFASCLFLLGLSLVSATSSLAHFGMVIPDANIVGKDSSKNISLHYLFWHPMENQGLNLEKPKAELLAAGQKTDLSGQLGEVPVAGFKTWKTQYQIKKPGNYIFSLTPQPYWEPAEDKYIIHYSKTVVNGLGADEGWDKPVGAKMEILPLTRPYGLYERSTFTGKALFKGKPAADCDVEIEYYNADGSLKAPSDPYLAMVVKTDSNGVFSFSAPWAGWWGFAALHDDDVKLKKDGKDKKVELGGVIWVYFHPSLK